jgi:hypothetical protein
VPLPLRRKALHQLTDFGSEVRLELCITNLQVIQQLLSQHADVAFVHQRVHQLERPPAVPAQGGYARFKLISSKGQKVKQRKQLEAATAAIVVVTSVPTM